MSSKTTSPTGRVFRCRHCQKPFVSLEKFAIHKREAHGEAVEVLRSNDKSKSPRGNDGVLRQFKAVLNTSKDESSSTSCSVSSSSKYSSPEDVKGARLVPLYERVAFGSGKRSSGNLAGTNGALEGKVSGANDGSLTSSFEINEDSDDSDDSDDDVQIVAVVGNSGDITHGSGLQRLGKGLGKRDNDFGYGNKVALKRAAPLKIQDDSEDSDDSDEVQVLNIVSSSPEIKTNLPSPCDFKERHGLEKGTSEDDKEFKGKTEVGDETGAACTVTGESRGSVLFATTKFDGRKGSRPVAQVVGNSHKNINTAAAVHDPKTSSLQGAKEHVGNGAINETFKNRKEYEAHAGIETDEDVEVLGNVCEKADGGVETLLRVSSVRRAEEKPNDDDGQRNACAALAEESGSKDLPLTSPVAELQNGTGVLTAEREQKEETSPPLIRLKILPVEKSKHRYKCWECTEIFTKKNHRDAHAKTVHAYGIPFECEICSLTFAQERSLTRHRKSHEQNGETQNQEKGHPDDEPNANYATTKTEFEDASAVSSSEDESSVFDASTLTIKKEESKPPKNVKKHHQLRPGFLKAVKKARRKRKKEPFGPVTYRCTTCSRKFSNKAKLQVHVISHSNPDKYPCLHCGVRFKNIHGRNIHSTKIHGRIQVKAADNSTWTTSSASTVLINNSRNSIEFQCSYCELTFASFSQQEVHERTHEEKPYLCQFCGDGFMTSASCKQHEATHVNPHPYQCSFCPATFATQNGKVGHVLDKHSSIPFPGAQTMVQEPRARDGQDDHPMDSRFKRPEETPKRRRVAEWINTQKQVQDQRSDLVEEPTGSSNSVFAIPLLPQGTECFPIPASKVPIRHTASESEKTVPSTVAQPGLGNARRQAGTSSKSSHSGFYTKEEVEKLQANLAAKMAKRLRDANQASESQGDDSKRPRLIEDSYLCPICSKTFIGKEFINMHMLSHQASSILHGDDEVIISPAHFNQSKPEVESTHQEPICGACGMTFKDNGSLRRHAIASHSEHQCHICHKRLASIASLQSHLKAHQRQYPCEKCSRKYETDEQLQTHYRKFHKREKGYKCLRCGQCFYFGSQLLKHVKKDQCISKILQSSPVFPTLPDVHGSNCAVKKLDALEGSTEQESGRFETAMYEETVRNTNSTNQYRHPEPRSVSFHRDSSFEGMHGDPTVQRRDFGHQGGNEGSSTSSSSNEFYFKCSMCEKELREMSLVEAHLKLHQEKFMLNFGLVSR